MKTPNINIAAVITTPPAPAGRRQLLTKTHTHQFAQTHNIPVFTPAELTDVKLKTLNIKHYSGIDCFLTAGYSKLLPPSWLRYPKLGALNLHFSLLPKFRGANPAEWAILLAEKTTGISLIKMSTQFDTGAIYHQATIPITSQDTRESLYQNLYELGAQNLPTWLSKSLSTIEPLSQHEPSTPPAHRFTRAHGFIHWHNLLEAMSKKPLTVSHLNTRLKTAYNYLKLQTSNINHQTLFIERAVRALYGYPGVWTYVPTIRGKKRLKILSATVSNGLLALQQVQLEGSSPAHFNQIKNQLS